MSIRDRWHLQTLSNTTIQITSIYHINSAPNISHSPISGTSPSGQGWTIESNHYKAKARERKTARKVETSNFKIINPMCKTCSIQYFDPLYSAKTQLIDDFKKEPCRNIESFHCQMVFLCFHFPAVASGYAHLHSPSLCVSWPLARLQMSIRANLDVGGCSFMCDKLYVDDLPTQNDDFP